MSNGVEVTLDEWETELGQDLALFMEKIGEAENVVIVCTPNYAAKANSRPSGVGFQTWTSCPSYLITALERRVSTCRTAVG